MQDIKTRLNDRLQKMKTIDTHEHLWDESWRLQNSIDWTGLFRHYGISVFAVAGMNQKELDHFYDPDTPHDQKWAIFSKYYDLVQNTAVIRAVLEGISKVYGLDEWNTKSAKKVTQYMKETVKPGFYRRVLRENAGISYCMVNCFDRDPNGHRYPARLWGDTELLVPDLFVDSFVYPTEYAWLEQQTGIRCDTLSNWLQATDAYFERVAPYCGAIKIGLAYRGSLDFDPGVSRYTAETVYRMHKASPSFNQREVRPLVDYLFYHVLGLAKTYELPIKFHTGLYSGTYAMNIDAQRNNIRDLAEIAKSHRENRFVAMHMAYPYTQELLMAIKQIPNFYADMSWAWILDPEAAKNFLRQALTCAPISKVTAFGGDDSMVENTVGQLVLAKSAMAEVLSEFVHNGYFTFEQAVQNASFLLYKSADRLYG